VLVLPFEFIELGASAVFRGQELAKAHEGTDTKTLISTARGLFKMVAATMAVVRTP
jgi:hypothetical protein